MLQPWPFLDIISLVDYFQSATWTEMTHILFSNGSKLKTEVLEPWRTASNGTLPSFCSTSKAMLSTDGVQWHQLVTSKKKLESFCNLHFDFLRKIVNDKVSLEEDKLKCWDSNRVPVPFLIEWRLSWNRKCGQKVLTRFQKRNRAHKISFTVFTWNSIE